MRQPLQVELVAGTCSCRTRCSGRAASSMRRALPSCAESARRRAAAPARSRSRCSDASGSFAPARREELDAVVVERVVRGADHDAGGQAQRARQVGDAGVGSGPDSSTSTPAAAKPGFERRLEHVAGDARVLADQHRRARAVARRVGGEHAARGLAELQHEVGRDRRLADRAADAVGAEIASCSSVSTVAARLSCSAPRSTGARHTFSASTVARTSCTRTMRAPRCDRARAPRRGSRRSRSSTRVAR